MAVRAERIASIVKSLAINRHLFEAFGSQVETAISRGLPQDGHIHSIKKRIKSDESLAEKILKKRRSGKIVTSANVLKEITDICGVRLIHIFPQDINVINTHINKCIEDMGWHLREKPKAYSWDPESVEYLKSLNLKCYLKPSYYTSVHYIVSPRKASLFTCEIQVRSLLEELWAEVDHRVKYKSNKLEMRETEHLAVLARLVSAGSKIVSSLYRQ